MYVQHIFFSPFFSIFLCNGCTNQFLIHFRVKYFTFPFLFWYKFFLVFFFLFRFGLSFLIELSLFIFHIKENWTEIDFFLIRIYNKMCVEHFSTWNTFVPYWFVLNIFIFLYIRGRSQKMHARFYWISQLFSSAFITSNICSSS